MQKAYQRIIWENEPSTATPLNEDNLNRMDYALNEIDNRVIEYAQYTEDAAESARQAAASAINAQNSAIDSANSATNASASNIAARTSELNARSYELSAESSKNAAAQSEHNAAVSESNAKTSENNALDYQKLSESHNHGNTGVREGEDTDNSKYWSEQSHASAESALSAAESASEDVLQTHTDVNDARAILAQIKGYSEIIIPEFWLDVLTGKLYISDDVEGVDFQLDTDTCKLYYKFIPLQTGTSMP